MADLPPILKKERPNTFFKYHRLGDHLDSMLKDGQFWFCPQEDLNDSIDGMFDFSEEMWNMLFNQARGSIKKTMLAKHPEIREEVVEVLEKRLTDESLIPMYKNDIYNMLFHSDGMGFRITCFTTEPFNELMWGHYTDGDKGVCLEFDLSLSPDLHKYIFPVEYGNDIVVINSYEEYPKAVLNKRLVWDYEEEWRIFSKEHTKPFNKKSLKRIYFGMKVRDSEIDRIRELLRENGYEGVDFKRHGFQMNGVKYRPQEYKWYMENKWDVKL